MKIYASLILGAALISCPLFAQTTCDPNATNCSASTSTQTAGNITPTSTATNTTSTSSQSGNSSAANPSNTTISPVTTNTTQVSPTIQPNTTSSANGGSSTATGNNSANQSSATTGSSSANGNNQINAQSGPSTSNSGGNNLSTGSSSSGGNKISSSATTGNNKNTNTAAGGAGGAGGQSTSVAASQAAGGASNVSNKTSNTSTNVSDLSNTGTNKSSNTNTNSTGSMKSSNTNSTGSQSATTDSGNTTNNTGGNVQFIPPVVPNTPPTELANAMIVKETTACGPLQTVQTEEITGTFFGLFKNSHISQGHTDKLIPYYENGHRKMFNDVPLTDGRHGFERYGMQATFFTSVVQIGGARSLAAGGFSGTSSGQAGLGTTGSMQQMVTTIQLSECFIGTYVTVEPPPPAPAIDAREFMERDVDPTPAQPVVASPVIPPAKPKHHKVPACK